MKIPPSTSSKSLFPIIKNGEGVHVIDDKYNRYLDFTGSNNTVILGYFPFLNNLPPNFPGVSYLEDEVSDILSKYTKTKHFRYFKNGSDSVSCAIRLARRILNNRRAPIFYVGYAGAHNEYARTINSEGIPDYASYQLNPNELNEESFESYNKDSILVYESRYESLLKNFPSKIKICDHLKSGIMGLWEENNADFNIYGKSLANGYPVSVITGRDKYMEEISNVYYSTTYGGDNVGLHAIKETINAFTPNIMLYEKRLSFAKTHLPKWKSIPKEKIQFFTENKVLFNGHWQIMLLHTEDQIMRLSRLCTSANVL